MIYSVHSSINSFNASSYFMIECIQKSIIQTFQSVISEVEAVHSLFLSRWSLASRHRNFFRACVFVSSFLLIFEATAGMRVVDWIFVFFTKAERGARQVELVVPPALAGRILHVVSLVVPLLVRLFPGVLVPRNVFRLRLDVDHETLPQIVILVRLCRAEEAGEDGRGRPGKEEAIAGYFSRQKSVVVVVFCFTVGQREEDPEAYRGAVPCAQVCKRMDCSLSIMSHEGKTVFVPWYSFRMKVVTQNHAKEP